MPYGRFIQVCCVFGVVLLAAGCASQPTLPLEQVAPWANQVPQFAGPVTAITEPVTVRYAPHPPAGVRTIGASALSDRGQATGLTKTIEGTRRVDRSGSNLTTEFLTERIEYASVGQRRTVSFRMTISIVTTDLGEVRESAVSLPPGVNVGKDVTQEVADAYREAFPKLVPGPTRQGEKLVEGTVRIKDSNQRPVSVAYDGILRGRTEHKGRDTLVVELAGKFQSDFTRGTLRGYALIDAKTGAWVYYENYGASSVSQGGRALDFYSREVHELLFPTGAW